MPHDTSASGQDTILGKIFHEDLRRGDFRRTMRRDYNELKELFLDDQRKASLKEMKRIRQAMFTAWWLLKALIHKLTPARRLLIVLALFLSILPHTFSYSGDTVRFSIETSFLALFILLFIVMLELKDKLLARDELEAGRAVQTALMPDRMPVIPGWSTWLFSRTANEVGGDLVDFQNIDANRYRVSVADVAGKGLKAALLTAKLQATLRAIGPDTKSLSELGTRINRIFYRDTLRSTFASLVCVELLADSGTVTIMNAGHLPPILIRGKAFEETKKGNPGIGILPELTCAEQQLELSAGNILLFYSDGLTEAKNEAGEFFGSQRLLNLLPLLSGFDSQEIGERIVQELDQFVRDGRMYDDLSLVVLKRRNQPGGMGV